LRNTGQGQSEPAAPRAGANTAQHAAEAAGGEGVVGLPIDQAEAILPPDLLQGGEVVILLLKPSPLYIILGCLGHLVAIGGLVFVLNLLPVLSDREALVMLVGLWSARLIWQFFEWLSRVYVLTDQRVIRVMGVLRVFVFEAQLKQVQHTESLFTIRERLFGLGTISFSTAGTGVPEAYWVMLRQPLRVHKQVIAALNRYR
jgi:hypothetical protein